MAQIESQSVLSLCIPIYNRLEYLERMLERFLEDKDLFEHDIALFISDNCSEDDLQSCCKKYQQKGLELEYHRNESNVGMDGNFELCLNHAEGKYVWLLGSDDIPRQGIIRTIVRVLKNSDLGLLHLSMRKLDQEWIEYHDLDNMAFAINYWFTYLSSNIIRTESLKSVDLSDYRQSFLIQVPAYLNACSSYQNNAVLYQPKFFESGSDASNNGGYNVFQVFVSNLYGIYESFINKELLSRKTFSKIIKIEYKEFLSVRIFKLLILHKKSNLSTEGGWGILWNYYGWKPYAYYYLAYVIMKYSSNAMIRFVSKLF